MSAETQANWMPRVLGSMMLRPGFGYIGASKSNNKAKYLPFVFSSTDTALIELTDGIMRVWVDDALVTRPSVTAVVANGTFDVDLSSWTDEDEGSAVSSWTTGTYMSLLGTGTDAAIRSQQVTVNEPGTQHALRVVVAYGPVILRAGSSAGDDDYIRETALGTGVHSLSFTPSSDFHIQLLNRLSYNVLVDSITLESSGVMEITAPWAEDDLSMIRFDQSGDVVFLACNGYQQQKIERRSSTSWSLVDYETVDGPFRGINVSSITITPSGLTGAVSLTASSPLFRSGHEGALFRITSEGQTVQADLTAEDTYSDPVRVTSVGTARAFNIALVGTWVANLTLQVAASDAGPWSDVSTYTSNVSTSYNDGLDNQILYYRIGIKTGGYTSGTVDVTLSYTGGTSTGVVRIASVSNSTSALAKVIDTLGSTESTTDWEEGAWSDYRGFPSSVAFFDGRLWWAGKDNVWGSVSDAFDSFDSGVEGDSGPISRTIGSGPVDVINWLLPVTRLLMGTDGAVKSARASTLEEPLTPTNFGLKDADTQGCAKVAAVKLDKRGIYVQRSGRRVHELSYDPNNYDYGYTDLTTLSPEIGGAGFTYIAVQRQPDTRIHCVRSDGKVAVAIIDTNEDVLCWVLVETDGVIEDAVVLPGTLEDDVYYSVARTVGGSTVRYLEKWAQEDECQGGSLNKQADSFISYTGASTSTITGLGHLNGESVVIWGDGKDLGTATVSGGSVALSEAVTNAVVGLPYTAQYKSTKLAYAAAGGTPLCQPKRVNYLGVILANTHYQGLQYGPDFDNLDDLPLIEDWAETAEDTVWEHYDREQFEFPKTYSTDSRICLQAAAPRPCTILAAVLEVETHG